MDDTVKISLQIRESVITMLNQAGSGHSAGSLDIADILSVLYFGGVLEVDPKKPDDPGRDRFILSAGHLCPALYAALALRGFFPQEELNTLRQFGSRLQGHPHRSFSPGAKVSGPPNLPGIENTAGPLGQGTSFAVGVALGLRKLWEQGELDRLPKVYCLCSDGELEEGQCWEAFMAAAKFKLNHLTFIIDRNGIQIDGFTETVMPLESLKDKLVSFGLLAIDVDGHRHQALKDAFSFDATYQSKPTVLIAHTVAGKGVGFMEGKYEWHGKAPDSHETVIALRELKSAETGAAYD